MSVSCQVGVGEVEWLRRNQAAHVLGLMTSTIQKITRNTRKLDFRHL
jgi:hypothetical protein